MRITFVVAAVDFGGGIRVIAQHAEGLRRKGHEVLVVSPPPYPTGRIAKFRNTYFPPSEVAVASHFDDTKVSVKFIERYRPVKVSDVPPADIIIATWWETAEWIASFPDDRGKKLHFVQDYEIWNGDKERVDACLKLPIEKITISSWLEHILVEHVGTPKPAIVLNGVDTNRFSQPERRMPSPPMLGFVYTSNFRKGSDIAVAALIKAKEHIPNLRCIAFGHEKPGSNLPLPDFVEYRLLPPQDEIPYIYGQCSVWLFTSREEGFGLPILEALACGTPVVATSAGAAPDILAGGGGILSESFEPEKIASQIALILRLNNNEWKNLSNESVKISSGFSNEISINKMEETLIDITRKPI
ncbi:MAG TPA: glycosyltransferase family 4 protein [Sphingopyxis sp.]|jgi:glycosyltransferase involved in cell wall biosynthesis|uniref:glycosyltransferase family 4 protein n=1 Tax=Sphingopyxis sp. TaxID=1908224 RepID=UPI002E1223B2|nr:glycosyltransferase family 4 protein [Sphingopyxis sp.]